MKRTYREILESCKHYRPPKGRSELERERASEEGVEKAQESKKIPTPKKRLDK